jgi:flagellar hook-length control protein FliK
VPQSIADEPHPKTAATPDGLAVNAAAPAAAPQSPVAAAATDATATGKPAVPPPPVFDQVAVNVAKAAADGLDKINIKLKPASLGHIEVHLEVASNGHVHAVIAADKPETLDLLQRDARSLERALGDAGLRTDSGSLSFNLRGQGQQYGGSGNAFAGYSAAPDRVRNDIPLPTNNALRLGAYLNSRAAAGGVDIRV